MKVKWSCWSSLLILLLAACGYRNAAPSQPNPVIPDQLPQKPAQTQPSAVSGDSTRSVTSGGIPRIYRVHIPPSYNPSRPMPLVIILHGYNLQAEDMVRITGFDAQADSVGFVTAYPQGSGTKPAWNGGNCCGEAQIKKVDDVEFIRQMLASIAQTTHIENRRIYATGFSNGAILAYRLACDLADQIAAVAPVSAAQEMPDCRPSRAVSVIHFHGTQDKLNPYNGSARFTSVKDSIQFWVQRNACPPQPQTTRSGSIVHDSYTPCAQNTAVDLYTIENGEHAWPGGESVTAEIGKPTKEISATRIIWDFFVAHPMP